MNPGIPIFAIALLLTACAGGSGDDRTDDAEGGGSVSGREYFVSPQGDDAADGSRTAPWRHVQFAIDRLQPGDHLLVQAGIYEETLLIGPEDSGEAAASIHIEGEAGTIIDGDRIVPRGRHALIEINGAGWIRLAGFELRNFRTAAQYSVSDTPIGLLITGGAHDLVIENLDIHHVENRSSCSLDSGCGQGANGIAVYGDSVTPIRNLRFVGNRVHDNRLHSSEAFTLNGNVDGFELVDNSVYDNNNIAFDFIGYEPDICGACPEEQNRVRNGIVRGNRALRNSSLGNPAYGNAAEGSAGGFYVDGGHHILFEHNESTGNDIGFEIASEHAGKASEFLVVRGNLIHHNLQAGLSLGGFSSSVAGEGGGSASNLWILGNTIHHNRGWGSEITLAYRVTDALFANNILHGTTTAAQSLDQQSNGGYSNLQWMKNLWWGDDGSAGSLPNADQLAGDPLFVDAAAGDFRLSAGSPAIDAAVEVPAIGVWDGDFWNNRYTGGEIPARTETDIEGNPRVVGSAMDLGALERQQVSP